MSEIADSGGLVVIQRTEDTRNKRRRRTRGLGGQPPCVRGYQLRRNSCVEGLSAPLAAPLARVQLVQAATELHNFSNGPVVCPPPPPHSSV